MVYHLWLQNQSSWIILKLLHQDPGFTTASPTVAIHFPWGFARDGWFPPLAWRRLGFDPLAMVGTEPLEWMGTSEEPERSWKVMKHHKLSLKILRPRLQQGERVRGGITSSKGQEVITSSKGKKQENKKEEARSKKQLQATSGKKQETRSQEATSGWKTGQRASFLVDSESNVRHCGRWPAGPVRPSGPCCSVWRARPVWAVAAGRQVLAAVARRPGPSLRTLLFWRGNRAVCELWRLEDRSDS